MSIMTEVTTYQHKSDLAEVSIATVGGLGVALIAMFLCVVPLSGNVNNTRDFVVFWATGQQLIHHANPYDAVAMDRIERAAGLPAGYGILYMRNPPWALPLALPLGLTGLHIGALLWSLALLACLVVSAWLIWQMYGSPRNRIHWIAVSFAPSLICLFMGQTSLFALLGLVLFLRLYCSHPFAAGLALWLCALKPHLFLPFGFVLLAWVIISKTYKVLAGAAVAMATSCAITWLIAPTAWRDYSEMMHAPAIEKEFIPCLSTAMRLWFRPGAIWLQFLPVALACVWALTYYWRRHTTWDWIKDGSLLMLISTVTAPYCWLYDQAVAMPALLQGAYTTRSRSLLAALALINIPIMAALMYGIKLTTAFYLWVAPMWLAWYLLAGAFLSEPSTGPKSTRPTMDSAGAPPPSHVEKVAGGAR